MRSGILTGYERGGGSVLWYGRRRNADRVRGGLVFKAHRLCVSLNSRLESNKEEEEEEEEGTLMYLTEF